MAFAFRCSLVLIMEQEWGHTSKPLSVLTNLGMMHYKYNSSYARNPAETSLC